MWKLKNLYNRLYLWFSDCDGMCDSCKPELKVRCYQYKRKETKL